MFNDDLELWTFCKDLNNIVSRTYYYTIEKYKSICEDIADEIWKEEFIKFKDRYKSSINFAEDYLGIKLKWYQKVLIKTIYKKNNLLYNVGRRY
jgi:hypothetical protein